MIVKIEGITNRNYVENLCLIFFPGAKFPVDEEPSPTVPML